MPEAAILPGPLSHPMDVSYSRLIRMGRVVSIVLSAALIAVLMAAAILAVQARAQEQVHSTDLEKFSGVYELSPKQFVYIQPWPGDETKLAYSDEAGQLRALIPVAESIFSAGPGLLLFTPTELQITFIQNSEGKVTRLIREQNGFPDRSARRLAAYKREMVSFRNGEISLEGILFAPSGKGVHPAMVLIHGTGAGDRNTVLPIVHFLVRHGMALLSYDKRGVGGSTGDWHTVSLEELAGDALAAVKFLQSRKEIDSKKIGVFGVSQGGWVAPLAASQSNDIAFVISVSGPAMSPAEVELGRLAHNLHARGFSENAVQEALALRKLLDQVARGKLSWEEFQAAAEKSRKTKWFPHAHVPPSADSWLFEHWRRLPLDYAPGPVIAKLHVPVLALFGGLDHTVLPDQNAEKWRVALEEGEVADYTIKIFPSGNHMLLEARTGTQEEYPTLKRFVPGYEPMLLDWLRERTILAR
ncbi:MAG: alpha/beta fold hydrolase [Acidobacteria bacterium]|nr:alpha/beta fold hydrolase [Acidobacteriota bacterium]